MRLMWLTDIHLNFLQSFSRYKFYRQIANGRPDVIVISGDIGESTNYQEYLEELGGFTQNRIPILFVHGNHDYWHSSVKAVKKQSRVLSKRKDNLIRWLGADTAPTRLESDKDVYLIGEDAFYDGRNGDYFTSHCLMRDFYVISELQNEYWLSRDNLLMALRKLADGDAKRIQKKLDKCVKLGATKIIVVTHIPPFKEVCLYRGELTDDEHLPFYSSQILGDTLSTFALEHPDIDILSLSGHTHGKATYQYASNLVARVGHAEYDDPEIQDIINI